MGSKQATRQNSTTNVDNTTSSQVTGIEPYQRQFAQQYGELSNTFRNRIAQPLNLQYSPAFSGSIDPIIQNAVSQGVQNLNASEGAAARDTANRLSVLGTGNNSALLAALNRTAQINNAGNKNALIPAALEQQRNFDAQRQQIEQAQNAIRLQERAQSVNELAPGLNLLQALNSMAGTSAGRTVREKGTTTQTGNSYTKRGFAI